MQLQMLGTGSAFAKNYYNNNASIYGADYTLMVDCGHTAMRALAETNQSLSEIDGILITHLHSDHVGGLEEVAFRSRYKLKKKLDLWITSQLAGSLWEHNLAGLLRETTEGFMYLSDFFQVKHLAERKPHHINNDLKIEILATKHMPGKPSYSLILNDFVFYSADIQFQPEILQEIFEQRNCQTVLHDVQFTDEPIIHASLNRMLTLSATDQKKILLMHYQDMMPYYLGKTGHMNFLQQHLMYTFTADGEIDS